VEITEHTSVNPNDITLVSSQRFCLIFTLLRYPSIHVPHHAQFSRSIASLDQVPNDRTSVPGYAPWSNPGGIANSLDHYSLQDKKWRTSLRYNKAIIRQHQENIQTPPGCLEDLPRAKLDETVRCFPIGRAYKEIASMDGVSCLLIYF
jgi:hypothetical protein